MTREERILSLETVVLRGARLAARQYGYDPDELVDLAWIAAIAVVDKIPQLSGLDLERVTYTAIRRRAIDYQRQQDPTIRKRRRIRPKMLRRVKLTSIEGVFHLPDERSARLLRATDARISLGWIRARVQDRSKGSPYVLERNWAMTYARVAGGVGLAEIAEASGVAKTTAGATIYQTRQALRRAATGSP